MFSIKHKCSMLQSNYLSMWWSSHFVIFTKHSWWALLPWQNRVHYCYVAVGDLITHMCGSASFYVMNSHIPATLPGYSPFQPFLLAALHLSAVFLFSSHLSMAPPLAVLSTPAYLLHCKKPAFWKCALCIFFSGDPLFLSFAWPPFSSFSN